MNGWCRHRDSVGDICGVAATVVRAGKFICPRHLAPTALTSGLQAVQSKIDRLSASFRRSAKWRRLEEHLRFEQECLRKAAARVERLTAEMALLAASQGQERCA